MITAPRPPPKSRLDADDASVAERFRSLDDPRRRRLACAMVRGALAELPVTLPPTILGLLGTAGIATPAQLADLDRRAASSGGPPVETDFRRARIVAAARYALSPQPRAAEEAVHEALARPRLVHGRARRAPPPPRLTALASRADGPVAQRSEQRTHNPSRGGSNPTRPISS